MDVLALYNAKGGVGKTTTAVNLAAALAEAGRRVLLVDLDAQGSASIALGVRQDGRALAEALVSVRALPVVRTSTEGVDLVPSGVALAGVDRALAQEPGADGIVRDALRRLALPHDLVILDPPPALGVLSVGSLAAARRVLVPVPPDPLALGGLALMLQALDKVRARLNPDLALAGIVLTMTDSRVTVLAREIVEDLRRRFGDGLLTATVRRSVRVQEAAGRGVPVLTHAPDSTAAEDFRALAAELVARLWPQAPATRAPAAK